MNIKTLTLFALTCFASALTAQEMPEMPEMPRPAAEHEWLERFVGEWESDVRVYMDPDAPPMEVTVNESFRSIGGFWVVGDMRGQMDGMPPFEGVYTIGYDPEGGKYIGTWIESTTGNLRTYEGTLEDDGRVLIMETEGPCPMRPGEITEFRERTEFRTDDHRVITSSILDENGEWVTNVRIESRRKEPQ